MRSPIGAAATFAGTIAAAMALGFGPLVVSAEEILGTAPAYATRAPGGLGADRLPNEAAITRRIWAPGLDDGFVPQGVTLQEGAIYLGAYQSADRDKSRGACRVFRIDPETGNVTATLDLPPSCGHAGGAAKGAPGRIWIVDTHVMFEVELANDDRNRLGHVVREVALAAPLKGSFAAGDGHALWLGGYERDRPGRLYRVPLVAIEGASIGASKAEASLELPTRAQGAAIDPAGRLWVTRSGSALGELLRLDPGTGAVQGRFVMPDGIEDAGFDGAGMLWSVSEAGSRRWSNWATHFPMVFRIDPARLR